MLITGQFRVNNNIKRITGRAPFDLILRFKPEIRINIETIKTEDSHNISEEAPATRREIELKKRNINLVRDIWDMSQVTAKKYYNIYKKEISFAIRDKILINVKNLRVRKSCKKLINRYIRPFKMSKSISPNAYELELSEIYKKLYRTFSVSLLEPYSRKKGEKPFRLIDLDKENRF
jgi:hypothetical protein